MPTLYGDRFAYVAFAGGGVRAIAHVGALKAAEELDFVVRGYAGTSAGAIVAAFASAGYRADEIFNLSAPEQHILRRIGIASVPDLFGPGWKRIRRFEATVSARGPLTFPRWLSFLIRAYAYGRGRKGLASTQPLREAVNRLLREKLVENQAEIDGLEDPNFEVKFKHIGLRARVRGTVDLKIVATDLVSKELVLFSYEDTPEVSVAEAVAASVALPFLFEPVLVGGRGGQLFVDGGLGSNLPAWIFKYEKLHEERRREQFAESMGYGPIPILAFGLAENTAPAPGGLLGGSLRAYFERIIATSLSASQLVLGDFVEDVTAIDLSSAGLTMLAFDAPLATLAQACRSGYDDAGRELEYAFITRPAAVDALLRTVREEAEGRLAALRAPATARTLRLCVVEPTGSRYANTDKPQAFRVTRVVGDRPYTDDRLILDRANSIAPRAFERKHEIAWPHDREAKDRPSEPTEPTEPAQPGGTFMTRHERALVWPQLRSVFAVPIFSAISAWNDDAWDRPMPAGVITFDCDEDICDLYRTPQFRDWAILRVAELLPAFTKVR